MRRALPVTLAVLLLLLPHAARAATLTDGQTWGEWTVAFAGYGRVLATGSESSPRLTLAPATASSPKQTHAALVVSVSSYDDLRVRTKVTVNEQLRENSAPNPWESGWLITRYQDPEHFYYVALKTNGWELGKRDPAYPGGQRFLATGSTPRTKVGSSQTVVLQAVGRTLTVKINGTTVVTLSDNERTYTSGHAGLYSEDARVTFSRISITEL